MTDFSVRTADWSRDLGALREVRTRVFIDEQKVPEALEWDEVDAECVHVLAEAQDAPVGTGRLTPDAHVGRMAVLPQWRGRGVGSRLLEALMEAARTRGDRVLRLNAQTHAVSFYSRYGFACEGEEFMEAGIPHVTMMLDLEKPAEGAALHGREALAGALLDLARSSRQEFALYAPDLAPPLTDRPELAATLRALAVGNRRARVRLLCRDVRRAARAGHVVLALAATLPSRFAVHRLAPEDEAPEELFAFADLAGGVVQPHMAQLSGTIALGAPFFARSLSERFEPMWQRSEPDPEARRLHL